MSISFTSTALLPAATSLGAVTFTTYDSTGTVVALTPTILQNGAGPSYQATVTLPNASADYSFLWNDGQSTPQYQTDSYTPSTGGGGGTDPWATDISTGYSGNQAGALLYGLPAAVVGVINTGAMVYAPTAVSATSISVTIPGTTIASGQLIGACLAYILGPKTPYRTLPCTGHTVSGTTHTFTWTTPELVFSTLGDGSLVLIIDKPQVTS